MKLLNSYTLTVVNGDAAGKEWRLFQDVVTLGRHEANHLVFTHPTVSNRQCKICAADGLLRVENLSQSNKTRLNDAPIDAAELSDGDLIQMGDIEIRVSMHENQARPVKEDAGGEDEDPHTAATQYIDPAVLASKDNGPAAVPSAGTPSMVGQYTIESKIAQSGQAILFKGCDASSGEIVALKLFTHDESDEVSEARFLRELKILKQLSHKNIVEYRGLFETKGEWGDNKRYLVMEYLQGKTLSELIKENPKGLEWDTVRNIFEQCLSGWIYASKEHNIIHRDIKPSNIFILEDGTAKIIDFGISRFDSESTHTGGSGMMGSFDCMAPDFALADDASFRGDMVSDIFSLFVCLYHVLTGSLPFPKYGDRQELEYLNRWRGAEAKRPSHKHISFRVIAHLGGFIDQGLAVEASKRFQSFDAVLDALLSLKNRKVVHKKVDSYELLSGLGSGGFGEVFLGKRKSDGAQVAIKRLHSGSSSKRFIKEASILSQYEHPAIVKYLDFFETVSSSGGRSPFLVLEYLEGTTLSQQRAEHPEGMDTKEVLQLFLRYLSALDFLHNAKASIIHRDIKPGNLHVPVDDPSQAKIFDLGIIKDLSGTQTSGKLPGTYYYMAPEMFTTDNRGTHQTDVYAMGLCLYEALTGSPAYPRLPKNDREAIVEMIARAQGERQYRVSYNHAAFRDHRELVRIVQQAINPDPNARYSEAKDMWEDIASVLELQFSLDVSAIGEGVHTSEKASVSGGGRRSVSRDKVSRVRPVGKKKKSRKGAATVTIIVLLLLGLYAAARWQVDQVVPLFPDTMHEAVRGVLIWPTDKPKSDDEKPDDEKPDDEKPDDVEPDKPKSDDEKPDDEKLDDMKPIVPTNAVPVNPDIGAEIKRLSLNTIKFSEYNEVISEVNSYIDSYRLALTTAYTPEDYPHIKEERKEFWATLLKRIIINGYNGYNGDDDRALIAVASGAYLSAIEDYSKIMGTEDIQKIQQELKNKMDAANFTDADQYFPVLNKEGFSIHSKGGVEKWAWWRKYAPNQLPDRFHALYLPLRAERKINVISRGQTASLKMDFALVPFDMMSDETREQVNLKDKPLNPFYMATSETTGNEMVAFWISENPEKKWPEGADPKKPYGDASLKEAIDFCNWLSKEEGLDALYESKKDGSGWNLDLRKPGYRLPFDFEWEYAARFGYDFFPESEQKNWETMKAVLEKEMADQNVSDDAVNSGLVNFYYTKSLRAPSTGNEYPLGMYDLCGNAPEICMTSAKLPGQLEKVEIEFIQMHGLVSDIEAVVPWLGVGKPNGIDIKDNDEAAYGFRVIRTVPVHQFKEVSY